MVCGEAWRGILWALLSYADSVDQTCLSSLAGLKGYCYKRDLWLCIIFSFQPVQTLSISKPKPTALATATRGVLYVYTFVVSNRINASLYGCRKCINTILLSVLDLWGSVPLLDSRWSWNIQMLGSRHGAEHMLLDVNCPIKWKYFSLKNCLFHKLPSHPPKESVEPTTFQIEVLAWYWPK